MRNVIVEWLLTIAFVSSSLAQDTNAQSKPTIVPERMMAIRLLSFPMPPLAQPPLAKRCSNAMARLKIVVNEDGKVSRVEFLSGFKELQEPSVAAVKQWSYKPYEMDGHSVAVETSVSLFYLGDGESFPMYVPDGKGGTRGGSILPLPPDCGPGPQIKRPPS